MNSEDPTASPRTLEHRLLRLLQAVRDTQDTSARAELICPRGSCEVPKNPVEGKKNEKVSETIS